MSAPSRSHGMTLIEVLTAMAILSLLAAGLMSAFQVGLKSYRQLIALDAAQSELVTTQIFLRQLLESVYPFEAQAHATRSYGLQGSSHRLEFTAPMPAALGAGHYRYELLLAPGNTSAQDLVVRAWMDRRGRDPDSSTFLREEILINDVLDLRIDFLEILAQGPGLEVWRGEWRNAPLPGLVRIALTFPPDDPRQWPDLIVNPRLTHEANCRFDVISRECVGGRP